MRPRRLLLELDRAHLRRPDRAHGADRDRRVAAPDLALHRAAVRVQVRGAGADRRGPRHPHHGRRVRPGRPGGDDVDGRGAADHPGLLALRHDHRVRPHPRERAAHAARHLLPDREPLDVRGAHPLAGHQLLHPDADRRAAALRRRDAAGLRVRAARGRGVRRLLVDLHRRAGAHAVEGARAGLRAPAQDHHGRARRRRAAVRLGRDRRRARRRPREKGAAPRRKRRAPVAAAAQPAPAAPAPAPPAAATPQPAPPPTPPESEPEPKPDPGVADLVRRRRRSKPKKRAVTRPARSTGGAERWQWSSG